MNTAYAHAQTYPHAHPHVHSEPGSDLLLTVIWFAVMVAACRTFYKFITRFDAKQKAKAKDGK